MINGGEHRGRREEEAYVVRPCNLNAQYSRVFNKSKACFNLIAESFSFFTIWDLFQELLIKYTENKNCWKNVILISDE